MNKNDKANKSSMSNFESSTTRNDNGVFIGYPNATLINGSSNVGIAQESQNNNIIYFDGVSAVRLTDSTFMLSTGEIVKFHVKGIYNTQIGN